MFVGTCYSNTPFASTPFRALQSEVDLFARSPSCFSALPKHHLWAPPLRTRLLGRQDCHVTRNGFFVSSLVLLRCELTTRGLERDRPFGGVAGRLCGAAASALRSQVGPQGWAGGVHGQACGGDERVAQTWRLGPWARPAFRACLLSSPTHSAACRPALPPIKLFWLRMGDATQANVDRAIGQKILGSE